MHVFIPKEFHIPLRDPLKKKPEVKVVKYTMNDVQ
jgi:hypothetical protein